MTGRNVTVTLTADRAMGTPTNQVVGQWGHMEFVQPVGGGCNVTFPGEFDPMGTPRLDETASARTVFGYYVQATNASSCGRSTRPARTRSAFTRSSISAASPRA